MIAGVLGTFFGGPLADRFGKKTIIVFSMLGSAPLALLLPHVSLVWVVPLFLCIGFISSSSFSVIVVYAQELVPKSRNGIGINCRACVWTRSFRICSPWEIG